MFEIKIGNTITNKKSSFRFLEVVLDENISWKGHIKTIKVRAQYPTKFSRLNYILRKYFFLPIAYFQFRSEDQNRGMKSSIKKKKD